MAISTATPQNQSDLNNGSTTATTPEAQPAKANHHLLQNKWVLWYRPPANHSNSTPKAAQWEDSQKQLFEADTVENFWQGFHTIPRITNSHPVNCDYSLFKEGVKPMWEDEFNQFGGRWTFTIERQSLGRSTTAPMPHVIEQVWLDVMLCLIGEGFDPNGDKIAGGVCGIRGARTAGNAGRGSNDVMQAKIHIWTKEASDVDTNMKIGEILKKIVQASDGQLMYSPHDNQGTKGRGSGRTLRI